MLVDLEIEEREIILSCLIDLSVEMKNSMEHYSELELLKIENIIAKIKSCYY